MPSHVFKFYSFCLIEYLRRAARSFDFEITRATLLDAF